MDLWARDKQAYRNRYYLNGPSYESTETLFGKKVAKMLEDNVSHPVLDRVPRYKFSEYRIKQDIDGVPFLGVIDSFSKKFKRIIEYKTGRQEWDEVRVRKHEQLVVYSLLTKLKFGMVVPLLKLVWIETHYKKEMGTIGSITCETESNELDFTGKIKVFKREIEEWERKRMKKTIIEVANQISEDYAKFLQGIH